MGLWFRVLNEESFHVTACNFIATLSLRSKMFKWVLKRSWISQKQWRFWSWWKLCSYVTFLALRSCLLISLLLEVVDTKTRLLWYLWYLGWFFSYLPETLPCFLFFLVVILDVLLCYETITILAAESTCANVRSRIKVRFKENFCKRLKNVLEEKKAIKTLLSFALR